ncbi:unnamed protein product, partial [Phaeothamnion confervicola]
QRDHGRPQTWPEYRSLTPGDVLVTIEYCHACERHRMTFRHNADTFLHHAHAARDLLVPRFEGAGHLRLQVLLKPAAVDGAPQAWVATAGGGAGSGGGSSMSDGRRRMGAFEVQVAALGAHGGTNVHLVHSKLQSGCWPRLPLLNK